MWLLSFPQLLQCFGRGVTKEELRLLSICLNPQRISLRDFLNVLSSSFTASYPTPKTQLTDAFKLHSAAQCGKKSQTVMGQLDVDDGDFVPRETWQQLSAEFAKPITGTTPQARQNLDQYLAKIHVRCCCCCCLVCGWFCVGLSFEGGLVGLFFFSRLCSSLPR